MEWGWQVKFTLFPCHVVCWEDPGHPWRAMDPSRWLYPVTLIVSGIGHPFCSLIQPQGWLRFFVVNPECFTLPFCVSFSHLCLVLQLYHRILLAACIAHAVFPILHFRKNSTCYWCASRTWPLSSSSLWLNGTQCDPWSWHQTQPGALLGMRILRSQPKHTESETLGMGPTICVVTRPLGGSESIEGTYPTGFCLRYNLKF